MQSSFVSELFLVVFLCTCQITAASAQRTTNYSTWMATSIISRGEGILTGNGDVSQLLQAGFTQKAFRGWLERYPDDPDAELISSYIKQSTDSVVAAVSNAAATINTYPLDRLSNGDSLIALYQSSGNETYGAALSALRQSIDLQPRNAEGGLFYYVYPYWSYLDGMYSLAPFYTRYTELFDAANTSAVPDDMLRQLDLLWQHCRVNASGLLVHGYDDSRTAVWADPVTGASPHVWGRSLGWYLMALVDTLELLMAHGGGTAGEQEKREKLEEARQHLLERFAELAAAVVRAVDGESGAWWQVLDQPGRAGNYIESSGSAMFAYALLKGARMGFLAAEPAPGAGTTWTHVASRAYEYLVDRSVVVDDGNGTLGFNGTVSVCSLNSTASYEYYIGRPIKYNSVLGSAAFVLASVEYEALSAGSGK
ncbi:glycoside hydrolase family 105 protein [Diplodia corticola]|uniref:Glycoside hydrolase family 105 protein n=1 Tax=Diplodia corticola TaxID=236234 RepID=A0A1J9S4S3_9PEZI|nr:glycoside hydrolase family 105 protein [Diplodia corticola]OJD34956.1 glycoside hydrolase family 105 protein [Diplodia corticola]